MQVVFLIMRIRQHYNFSYANDFSAKSSICSTYSLVYNSKVILNSQVKIFSNMEPNSENSNPPQKIFGVKEGPGWARYSRGLNYIPQKLSRAPPKFVGTV